MKKYVIDEKRYAKLLRDEEILDRLNRGGVDNWYWYDWVLFRDYDRTVLSIADMDEAQIIKFYGQKLHEEIEE